MLDARSALSVTERATYIAKVRNLAKQCAQGYLELRETKGFPLLKNKS
jgi:glycyl-tRNA synthetase alpha chain